MSGRVTYSGFLTLLGRVVASEDDRAGYEAQVLSASKQIGFVAEELSAKEYLVGRGLVTRPEALRLRRTDAEISGKLDE